MEQDWDIAIVLDACRYDFFKEFYRYFFDGTLKKAISRGSCTPEWFRNTFTSFYKDTVYISANPFINSLNIKIAGCRAKSRFAQVVDVWNHFWDPLLGTVLPQSVNRALLDVLDAKGGKRLIAHYLQPHAPYISPRYFVVGFPTPELSSGRVLQGISRNGGSGVSRRLNKPLAAIGKIAMKLGLGIGLVLRVRDALNLPPLSPLDATRRVHGVRGLRRAYAENLLVVLETLTFVLDGLDGRVVITSDHGEFLGERSMFSHPCGVRDPILTHVPYFVVKSVKKPAEPKFSRYPLKLRLKLVMAKSHGRPIGRVR